MSIGGLVFNMGRINGNFAGLFFGRPIDLIVGECLTPTFGTQYFRNGLCQGRLAVIDVSDRTNVHVWFVPTELFHRKSPALRKMRLRMMILVVVVVRVVVAERERLE
jgi:hypothetical protein